MLPFLVTSATTFLWRHRNRLSLQNHPRLLHRPASPSLRQIPRKKSAQQATSDLPTKKRRRTQPSLATQKRPAPLKNASLPNALTLTLGRSWVIGVKRYKPPTASAELNESHSTNTYDKAYIVTPLSPSDKLCPAYSPADSTLPSTSTAPSNVPASTHQPSSTAPRVSIFALPPYRPLLSPTPSKDKCNTPNPLQVGEYVIITIKKPKSTQGHLGWVKENSGQYIATS